MRHNMLQVCDNLVTESTWQPECQPPQAGAIYQVANGVVCVLSSVCM